MRDFRCDKCHQLQFKYSLDGDNLVIETKCYACNTFSTFRVCLNRVQHDISKSTELESNK